MADFMHTNDLLTSFPDKPCFRADLLPGWVKGMATMITFISLFCALGVCFLAFGNYGNDLTVLLVCCLLGLGCGVAAAGLLMEFNWGLWFSLLTTFGVLLVFCAFLGYDLFFVRRKVVTIIGIEIFVLTMAAAYFRALWKLRGDWKTTPAS